MEKSGLQSKSYNSQALKFQIFQKKNIAWYIVDESFGKVINKKQPPQKDFNQY